MMKGGGGADIHAIDLAGQVAVVVIKGHFIMLGQALRALFLKVANRHQVHFWAKFTKDFEVPGAQMANADDGDPGPSTHRIFHK